MKRTTEYHCDVMLGFCFFISKFSNKILSRHGWRGVSCCRSPDVHNSPEIFSIEICLRNICFPNRVRTYARIIHFYALRKFRSVCGTKNMKNIHTHIVPTNISRKVVYPFMLYIYIWLITYCIRFIWNWILIIRDTAQKSYFSKKSIFYVGIDLVHKFIRECLYFTSSSHKIHIENTNFLCVFQNMLRNYM